MKLGIMQPYLFPYLGYFQLINEVDEFVIYDDVNFIKQGYINKNNILVSGSAKSFTLQLQGASSFKKINEVEVGSNNKKLLKTIEQAYSKAPFFKDVMPLVEEVLSSPEKNLAKYVGSSIQRISDYLQIDVVFHYSSEIEKKCDLKSQDKVINICENLNAAHYINSIGGQELYSKDTFEINNIKLSFIKTQLQPYEQFEEEFVPYLSIVDVLMFNDVDTIKQYLKQYELI